MLSRLSVHLYIFSNRQNKVTYLVSGGNVEVHFK